MPLDAVPLDDVLYIDNFAGGGGASTGIERAIGRSPDVAINHDAEAVALHELNHPETLHLCQNVWKADPREVVRQASAHRCAKLGIPFRLLKVRGLWFSPDCKHFSKAKGSKPVEKGIRDLAWVAVHWARLVKPDQIWLENVEEFRNWGPLIMTADGKYVPCPVSKGLTFKRWIRAFRKAGATAIEWRELRGYHYGAPTIRKRLFVIIRFDGKPIIWPEPTHDKPAADGAVPGGRLPWRTAAECIDWSLPCPSIFGRDRELVGNTMRRLARGVMRHVVNAKRPFIVGAGGPAYAGKPVAVAHPVGTLTTENHRAIVQPIVAPLTHHGGDRAHTVDEPVRTVTAAHRGEMALIAPHVTKFRANSDGHRVDEPIHTVTANSFIKRPGGAAPIGLVSAVLTPRYGEREGQSPRARPITEPMATVVPTQNGATLVAASISTFYGEKAGEKSRGAVMDEPLRTQTTENRHAVAAAFLAKHYGGHETDGAPLDQAISTVTARDHHALVAAHMVRQFGTSTGMPADHPVGTVMADGGGKTLLATSALSPDDQAGAQRVAAFIAKYYGTGVGQEAGEPLHTIPTKDRFAVVTVNGWPIVDLGMRMLQPRELYRAQGFPDDYIIDGPGPNGKPLSKTAQVRMCGNSVCPPVAEAIVRANLAEPVLEERAAD
ncbi:MAG: DNA cytosine methyltransferase [Reyranella sp.]|uniref:DNA cytosine methyltransferase n=1 Tax=Reyranella sp. TaxID=1929291 RepID=UPI0025F167A5|nr:DNA cytosine methyltransferase [Reyranella sp.]MBR2819822.1 DNA cytosine methyltransferase [Reyranella sp.]